MTARAVQAARIPVGTRVPVTSLTLVGDRIAFWTIVALGVGEHVELTARAVDGELLRVGLVVANVHLSESAYLSRVDCDAESPGASDVANLVAQLLAAASHALAA